MITSKYLPEFNEEKFEKIKKHPYFSECVAHMKEKAEKFLSEDVPRIRFSQMHLFTLTGDRSTYQAVYNAYVDRLNFFAFLYFLEGEKKYLDELSDIIWNICDFETWTIPAHIKYTPEERRKTMLDLTSCKMGLYLSEILHFLGDDLIPTVRDRVKYELRYRIIDSFRKYDDFWWMKTTNNWASVCGCGVFATYLYEADPAEIDAQLPRFLEIAENYLRGFDDEGCCKEGYGYWNYGFSHFCQLADLLRKYTNGEVDFFKREKVHNIAKFQEVVALDDGHTVNFSDCGIVFSPMPWFSHFLKREYPDITLPNMKPTADTSGILRTILWCDPDIVSEGLESKSFIYHENQWFIYKSSAYNMAVKAGSNCEFHNHNDIGTFMISKNNVLSVIDPGSGPYTRQYFSSERYNYTETSSRGHAVPIINDNLQYAKAPKSTILTERENEYAFTMDNGYDDKTLRSLVRRFVCEKDSFTVTDTYEFTEQPTSLCERFPSFTEPKLTEEGVRIADTLILYDRDALEVSFTTESLGLGNKTLHVTVFTPKKLEKNFSLKFKFV